MRITVSFLPSSTLGSYQVRILMPISQIRKMRFKVLRSVAQEGTGVKSQSWDGTAKEDDKRVAGW